MADFCAACAKEGYHTEGLAREALGFIRARRERKASIRTGHRRARTSSKRYVKRGGHRRKAERSVYVCDQGWWHLTSH